MLWHCFFRPSIILYALALAVSFIAVNIHVGFTIYASRVFLLMLIVVIVLRSLIYGKSGIYLNINPVFVILFILILFVQSLSLPLAENPVEHARIMFIYVSMMAIFIAVLILGSSIKALKKAVRFFLGFGIVQGAVGVYQVVGAIQGWPMYQKLIYGNQADTIKTGNPRHLMGVFYSGFDAMPRAFGFLSDVNQYGGYLVVVILLALAFLVFNRRDILAYLALFFGGAGLVLSLSRSAWLTLIVFGLPALIFLMKRAGFFSHRLRGLMIRIGFVVMLILAAGFFANQKGLFNIQEVISKRIVSFVSNESSAEGHILTRLAALDAWKTSPLIGIGFDYIYSGWYSARYDHLWFGAHSHYFNVLAGCGIFGLGLEMFFMAVVFLYMWRGLNRSRSDSQERMLMVGLLAVFISILFGNLFYHYYMNDFVWFIMGCGVALSRRIVCETKIS